MNNSKIYNKSFFILIIISIVIIPMITIFILTYNVMSNQIIIQSEERESQIESNLINKIEFDLQEIESLAKKIANNCIIGNESLQTSTSIERVRILDENKILFQNNEFVKSVYIYLNKNSRFVVDDYFYSWNYFYDKEWKDLYDNAPIQDNKNLKWFFKRGIPTDSQSKFEGATLIMDFPIIKEEKLGYVVLNIDTNKLFAKHIDINTKQYNIISGENKLLFGENVDLIHRINANSYKQYIKFDNKDYVAFTEKSAKYDFSIVGLLEKSQILRPLESIKIAIFCIVGICILILIFSYIISRNLYYPINELLNTLKGFSNTFSNAIEKRNNQDLNLIKENIKKYINEKDLLQSEMNNNREANKILNLRRLLRNEVSNNEIENILDSSKKEILVITLEDYSGTVNKDFFTNIKNAINKIYENNKHYEVDIDNNIISIILLFDEVGYYSNNKETLKGQCIETLNCLGLDFIVIGIGEAVYNTKDINRSYLASITSLKYRIIKNELPIIFHDELPEENLNASYNYPIDLENKVIIATKERNLDKVAVALDELTQSIVALNAPPDLIFSWSASLREKLFGLPLSLGYKPEEIMFRGYSNLIKKYSLVRNLYEMNTYFFEICRNIIDGLNVKMNNKNSDLIENIKEYIINNITNQISLNSVAEIYGISPSYLSSLFKQETGEKFINYLLNVKIKLAEKLITETKMSIKDIAQAIGYADQRSFYNSFKKHTGLTATEYRNTHRKRC